MKKEKKNTIDIKLPLDMNFWEGNYVEFNGDGYFQHRNGTIAKLENNDWEKQDWTILTPPRPEGW